MKLHELTPAEGSTKVAKRIGRGHGSGNGKTAGKGHKGQKARSGGSIRPGFEGGQMPLQRRVPKRGFNNIFAAKAAIVNLGDIDARFEAGAVVDAQALIDCGLVKDCKNGVKVLGNGEMTKSLTIQAKSFSKSAQDKIEGAGGKAEVILGVRSF